MIKKIFYEKNIWILIFFAVIFISLPTFKIYWTYIGNNFENLTIIGKSFIYLLFIGITFACLSLFIIIVFVFCTFLKMHLFSFIAYCIFIVLWIILELSLKDFSILEYSEIITYIILMSILSIIFMLIIPFFTSLFIGFDMWTRIISCMSASFLASFISFILFGSLLNIESFEITNKFILTSFISMMMMSIPLSIFYYKINEFLGIYD